MKNDPFFFSGFVMRAGLLICLVFMLHEVRAQEDIKQYVRQNAVQVNTIDPGATENSDLKALGEAIGDAGIVMLGEQDHGDAPAFLAKSRIIRYLHEVKGFDVIAFESDFFSLNYGWDKIKKEKAAIHSFIKKGIYPLWASCDACEYLFYNYIPSAVLNSGLEITGFDDQVNNRDAIAALDSTARQLGIPVTLTPGYATEILPVLRKGLVNAKDAVISEKYVQYLNLIRNELNEKLSENDFWIQLIQCLVAELYEYKANDFWEIRNTRDRQMAANLKWLSEVKYPGKKIIVWAHNYHVSKYSGHFPQDFLNKGISMGTVFTSDSNWAKKTYIIGFTSYEGTAGRLFPPTVYKVDKPQSNSFENWINGDFDFSFVDFRKFNTTVQKKDEQFFMSGAAQGNNWYHKNSKASWNRIFDGVFFIRKMYPCKMINQ